ncbi:hypothetical protein ABMA28_010938 [Loxostege sticticalis]|uniref:THAP-type domain-containing protein n=1 Tax=Loxostege sticticalis TaxID=481309 RepID=A0ABD0S7V6_LOXSC
MVGHSTCCVIHCTNNGQNSSCKFYLFPEAKCNLKQRKRWIAALKRKNADGSPWQPKPHDTICSAHFIGGKMSEVEASPSYVPTIFPLIYWSQKDLVKQNKVSTPQCQSNRKLVILRESKNDLMHRSTASKLTEPAETLCQFSAAQMQENVSTTQHQSNQKLVIFKESENDLMHRSPATKLAEPAETLCQVSEKAEIKTEPPEPAKQLCSVCNESMSWFVFACVQCVARVCSACDARGHHAAHYVLRVPGGRPESELQAVLNKVREVLLDTNLVETGQPSIVPDIDRDCGETNIEQDLPEEPEYDVIKMEVKTEEEENLAEDQSLLWDPLSDVKETAESASQLTPNNYDVASTPSVTLTASNPPSEVEKDPLATANISWTDYMDRHLIRSYILIAQTEWRKSQIYSRLKKEFVKAFPHIKVTRKQLEEKLRIILSEKLTSDELYELRNEIHDNFSRQPNAVVASPLNVKGVRSHLAKVTSGEEDTKTQQQCQDIEDLISPSLIERYAIVLKYKTEEQKNLLEELPNPRVNEGKKLSQQFNRKRKLNNKTKIQQGQNIEDLTSPSLIKRKKNTKYEEKVRLNLLEELHPVRSGRARRVPVRLLT